MAQGRGMGRGREMGRARIVLELVIAYQAGKHYF